VARRRLPLAGFSYSLSRRFAERRIDILVVVHVIADDGNELAVIRAVVFVDGAGGSVFVGL
jgi:hypothetical protein